MNVYVITSSSSIDEIKNGLEATEEQFWAVKIIYTRHPTLGIKKKMETNKTIVVCTKACIEAFKLAKEFTVSDYDWKGFPKPDQATNNHNLHFAGIPSSYTEEEARSLILKNLHNIVSENQIKFLFPLKSRESGHIKGYGNIILNTEVDFMTRCICKLVLHNTPIAMQTGFNKMMTCHWYRFNTTRTKALSNAVVEKTPKQSVIVVPSCN